MGWLIGAATIVQAAAAIILVWFTRAAIAVSRRAADAATEQMRQSVLPALMLETANVDAGPDGVIRRFKTIIANLGIGPAFNVQVVFTVHVDQALLAEHRTWQSSALGAREQVDAVEFVMDPNMLQLAAAFQQRRTMRIARVELDYEDAYQRPGSVRGAIMFDYAVPPGNSHARFEMESFQLPGAASRNITSQTKVVNVAAPLPLME